LHPANKARESRMSRKMGRAAFFIDSLPVNKEKRPENPASLGIWV
jgi:hypothetical protein